MSERAATSPNLTARGRVPAVLRVLTELIAWVTVPWGLASYSVAWSVVAVLVLIGLPTVFGTPGDKKHVTVAVPGAVTIALMVLQLAGAVWGARMVLPHWAFAAVCILAAVTVVAEIPRWRWLAGASSRSVGPSPGAAFLSRHSSTGAVLPGRRWPEWPGARRLSATTCRNDGWNPRVPA